jgi:hypothetical protein
MSGFIPSNEGKKPDIFMDTIVISKPLDVDNRLRAFGWTRENFNEVIKRMAGARNDCTVHHPLGAGGYHAWSEGTARLRDVGVTLHGWESNNDDHIPTIYSPERKTKIAVCNTNDGTGFLNRQPENWNKKGASFDRAVGLNQEGLGNILSEALDAMKVIAMPGAGAMSGTQLWYLCVYSESEDTRAELSLPYECEAGFFKTFRERIILIGGAEDGGIRRRSDIPGEGPDFEIVVTRKQG